MKQSTTGRRERHIITIGIPQRNKNQKNHNKGSFQYSKKKLQHILPHTCHDIQVYIKYIGKFQNSFIVWSCINS